MNYKFPYIRHLDDIRPAIAGRNEFIIAECDWGFVVNYNVNFADTFPTPNTNTEQDRQFIIRRECRGIKFDNNGYILSRVYHKFFNLSERDETAIHNVDLTQEFDIFDKLDGSMIHPILIDRSIILCTKMGNTDIALQAQFFAEQGKSYVHNCEETTRYMDFISDCIKLGKTPIFEWCSRKQRIVVDYGPQDHLILTAIRDNYTGEYVRYNTMMSSALRFNVPCVRRWHGDFNGIHEFVKTIQQRENEEGYVIRFHNGHMLKIKNFWYMQLHKTKELLTFEKDVWALILDDKHDDAKAFMDDAEKNRIDSFAHDLYFGIEQTAKRLEEIVVTAKNNSHTKKSFALEIVPTHSNNVKGLLFKIWDGYNSLEVVKNYVRDNLSTGPKLESVRDLANGIKWENY